MTRRQLKKFEIRHYQDNGQTFAYAYWADGSITTGSPKNLHMQALWERAAEEGLPFEVFGFPKEADYHELSETAEARDFLKSWTDMGIHP